MAKLKAILDLTNTWCSISSHVACVNFRVAVSAWPGVYFMVYSGLELCFHPTYNLEGAERLKDGGMKSSRISRCLLCVFEFVFVTASE